MSSTNSGGTNTKSAKQLNYISYTTYLARGNGMAYGKRMGQGAMRALNDGMIDLALTDRHLGTLVCVK